MTYQVCNLLIDQNRTLKAGYRILRVANYQQAIAQLYRPAMPPAHMRYGQHVLTAEVQWVGGGDEPDSRFLSDHPSPGVNDLLIINNLLSREKACLQSNMERTWHVTSVGPTVTPDPSKGKWPWLDDALSRVQGFAIGNEKPRLRSILWYLESWNTNLADTKLIILRDSFELLWKSHETDVRKQFEIFAQWLNNNHSGSGSLTGEDLIELLVIGRTARNFCTHSGGFLGGEINDHNRNIRQAIEREMRKPHNYWRDGSENSLAKFQAAVIQEGLEKVLISSIPYLDCVLYCLSVQWLGIDLSNISGAIDPLGNYVTSLVWNQIQF